MTKPAISLAATIAANTGDHYDQPYTARIPLREQAWTLYCQGEHSPEIGRLLGVSERTVRYWINHTLKDLETEHQELRAYSLDLAIARKRQIIASAFESYERLTLLADEEAAKALDGDDTANPNLARQALATGARYLAVANAADRDLARFHATLSRERQDPPAAPLPFPIQQPTAQTPLCADANATSADATSADATNATNPISRNSEGSHASHPSGQSCDVREQPPTARANQAPSPLGEGGGRGPHGAAAPLSEGSGASSPSRGGGLERGLHASGPEHATAPQPLTLDHLTPAVLARMAADGLLDDPLPFECPAVQPIVEGAISEPLQSQPTGVKIAIPAKTAMPPSPASPSSPGE